MNALDRLASLATLAQMPYPYPQPPKTESPASSLSLSSAFEYAGQLIERFPIATLIAFAAPFAILAWWKRIRCGDRLLAVLLALAGASLLIAITGDEGISGAIFQSTLMAVVAIGGLILAAMGRLSPSSPWIWGAGGAAALRIVTATIKEATDSSVSDTLLFLLALDGLVALVAVADLFTLPARKSLTASRESLKIVSLKKPHKVTLQLANRSNRKIELRVRDDVPQEFEPNPPERTLTIEPRSRVSLQYEMSASRRGAFAMSDVHVETRSQLGLWTRLLSYPAASEFHVYPDMRQLGQYAILARSNRLSLMGVRRTRKIGTDNDFERLRDYTFDDNYKFIDWRSTARRNKLTVKDFQTSQSQRVVFLIDCGRMMTNESGGISLLDHALNAMLMLSWVALKQGDSVGLLLFSDTVRAYVPPGSGMDHMNQLLHASFDKFPELVESRYDTAFLHLNRHCRKRSLVVLITNVIDEVNAHQIHSYLLNLVGKHLPLGVLLRDHAVFDVADGPIRTTDELYKAAAASEILLWRHQVLTDLEHAGVLMQDAFPEDMTAPLINRYLEAKARHLL